MVSTYRRIATDISTKGFAIVEAPPEIVKSAENIFAFAPDFFRQSSETKCENTYSSFASGYRGVGTEFSVSPKRYDLLESFSFLPAEESVVRCNLSESATVLYDLLKQYASIVGGLIENTISNLAQIYRPNQRQLSLFSARYSYTQLNCYEPFLHRRRILVDSHEDGVLLTALVANSPGLEILDIHGKYVSIESSCNTIVLMAGELLALLTGYSIKPIQHRVKRHHNQRSRLSLVHFANLNIDIHVAPWLVNEQNCDIDIVDRAINNAVRFGLPPLTSTIAPK